MHIKNQKHIHTFLSNADDLDIVTSMYISVKLFFHCELT